MCLTILILLDVGVSGLSDQKKTHMRKFNMFITAICVLSLVKLRWPKNKSLYTSIHRDKFSMFFVGVRAGHRLSNTVNCYLYQLILIITPHVSDLDFT